MQRTACSRQRTTICANLLAKKSFMDDYNDSAARHLYDADVLLGQTPQRLANASHLFGVSAECALKAIARQFHPNVRLGGRDGHIPNLFTELLNVSPAIAGNAALARSIGALQSNFASWQISERYVSQGAFAANRVLQEQAGAKAAHLLMQNCLGGLI